MMWPAIIVILNEFGNSFAELMPVICRIQINVFLFDSTPETFYPNIILASASAIHADTDMMLLQTLYPIFTGILTALVGIYYFRYTTMNRLYTSIMAYKYMNPHPIGM